MDSFQGSIPPNFISFRLENQTTEIASTSANPSTTVPTVSLPTEMGSQIPHPDTSQTMLSIQPDEKGNESRPDEVTSIHSADSDLDVTIYAESMVRQLESSQTPDRTQQEATQLDPSQGTDPGVQEDSSASNTGEARRASTPLVTERGEAPTADLSALESALRVVESSGSQLAELVDVTQPDTNIEGDSLAHQDYDAASSIGDAPPLPGGECKIRYLTDPSGDEGATDQSSVVVPVALYGYTPFAHASETEGGDETASELPVPGTSRQAPGQAESHREPPHLSGRSRAILKEYFDESPSVRLPVGHTTVSFTEPQVYHLLRVLTDETLSRSFSTMEQMVTDAVRGRPTVTPSRTAHFFAGRRAQTPGPGSIGDSSGSDSEGEVTSKERVAGSSSSEDTGDSSYYGESDNATELDLIAKSFKKPAETHGSLVPQASGLDSQADTPEYSSQDATLLEVRDQVREGAAAGSSKSKRKRGNRNLSKRGGPMREEFFAKIGWTRSFISGPADPLHNPHMVWCHICKKNFSIKSKGPYEILRHHRTERHLRRDQRWRYEHLRSTDPVTGKVQHRVRGGNGKLLSKVELAKELPKFIHVELVDIGERFPFYEDFVKGSTTALVTPESRTKTQLCLVGDFIKSQGDLMVLRNLWSRMGSFTNHQATFNDFDWGEERLSVSICLFHPLRFHSF